MNQDSNFIQYLSILLRWRRFIIYNFIAVTIIIVGITLLMPNWYKSTTTLLPPKQPDIFGSLGGASSLLKGIGSLGKLGGLGQKQGSYNYFAILKSRSTMEKVVNKFDLITVYDTKNKSMELAVKELTDNSSFEDEADDNISIQVYDKDPVRAANMANYFVEVLNEVNTRLGTLESKTNREFIEQRLNQCRSDLRIAEDALRVYQEKSGIMISSDEKNSSVSAYAQLYATKVKKDIEIAVLQKTVSADDSYMRQLKFEVSELNKRLDSFPSAGLESFRLYREVATQQKILEFVLPIYEQARMDEQKDIPVLLVLDKAVPAERKSKPQRSLIVLFVSFIAFTFSIALTFVMQGVERMDATESQLIKTLQRWTAKTMKLYRIKNHESAI